MNEVALNPQNWEAFLKLEMRRGKDKTHLIPIERYGPLSVQRPFYPESECCHVYLLHPPGGVVGGDKLDLHLGLQTGARALFTTPGANRFYLSAADTAHVTQQFELAADSQLEFLPQENIYFPGSQVRTRTLIRMRPGSNIMLWEKHCFGLPSNEESFSTGRLVSEIELRDEHQLIFTEKQRIDSDELNRASGLRQNPVTGSFLVCGARLGKAMVKRLREIKPLNGQCGITQALPELLIARYLGYSTADVNAYFVRLWELLRPAVLQREASHPRIWNT
jgi:urease accessory protein